MCSTMSFIFVVLQSECGGCMNQELRIAITLVMRNTCATLSGHSIECYAVCMVAFLHKGSNDGSSNSSSQSNAILKGATEVIC